MIRHLKKNTDARNVELLIRKIPQALSIYQVQIKSNFLIYKIIELRL